MTGLPNRIGQQAALDAVRGRRRPGRRSATSRTSTAPRSTSTPRCVIDDVWAAVGSDNLNRRLDPRQRAVGGGAGRDPGRARAARPRRPRRDGAWAFARQLRLQLWREHLGRGPDDDGDLLDPVEGFRAWRRAAAALTAWHEGGRYGPRPPGHAIETTRAGSSPGPPGGPCPSTAPGRPRRPPSLRPSRRQVLAAAVGQQPGQVAVVVEDHRGLAREPGGGAQAAGGVAEDTHAGRPGRHDAVEGVLDHGGAGRPAPMRAAAWRNRSGRLCWRPRSR